MIELIATAQSIEQAKALIKTGVDILYIGHERFGLRLPASFSEEEISEVSRYAHEHGKQVHVAMNALFDNERMQEVLPYLSILREQQVDAIHIGDPGIIYLLRKERIALPYVYDAQTMVTSAKQIQFWVERGASGAVVARELTRPELQQISQQVTVPIEVLVYGATCIFQSKRQLVSNYFNYIGQSSDLSSATSSREQLYITEKIEEDQRYTIYEDANGTHVFAAEDINLMLYLSDLTTAGLHRWKLDGLFVKDEARFVQIAACFVAAKEALLAEQRMGQQLERHLEQLNEKVKKLHPAERALGTGFYLKEASEIE